jgi:FHA domain
VSRSYRPGDWFGIFGERVTVVLPPSQKARVARIWALVDDGAGCEEVLDALIAEGLRELAGFVLVSQSGRETTVVIRGEARAELTTDEETAAVEGSSMTTWAERSFRDVRAMRIEVGEAAGVQDLVIRDGLVRISRTDRPAYLEPTGGTGFPSDHLLEAPAPELTAFPVPTHDPSAAAEQAEPPSASPEHDGQTQAGSWRPDDHVRSQPGIPGDPVAQDVLASPVARLTFSSGDVVDVDRTVLVGRAPEARGPLATGQPRLVSVASPHQEISATHLEIRPGTGADHGSAVVTDLGSTNGTVLQQPGLPSEDLQPGIVVQLLPGALIDLGDGVTIQVGHG